MVTATSIIPTERSRGPSDKIVGHKVYVVINYDGFKLGPVVEDEFCAAARRMQDRYYHGITRFTTSAFMKAKLGELLGRRGAAHLRVRSRCARGPLRTA